MAANNNTGWIKIYRSFLDWEWYSDTNCVRLALHLILKANYQPRKWQGTNIERGQLITSRGNLSDETGLSTMQVRTVLDKLEKCDFLTRIATKSYTLITICNYDKYQQKDMDDNQEYNQAITNEQPSDNQAITTTKEYKKERSKEYTHTLVNTERGIVRGKIDELLFWIETNCPTVASLPEPLEDFQIEWLLNNHDIQDIRRILAEMENKPTTKTKNNAYTTFVSFAKYDPILKEKRKVTANSDKLYTHSEVLDEVNRTGIAMNKLFESVDTEKGKRWRRI